jgi:hypothetical protein
MTSLGSGHSQGQAATALRGPARYRGFPPVAVRVTASQLRQSERTGPRTRPDGQSRTPIPTKLPKLAMYPARRATAYRARRGPAGAVMLILSAGLALEAILPWVVLWLSDVFFFDTPAWSRWLVFGVPPVLCVLALLLYRVLDASHERLCHATVAMRHRF